MEDMSVQIGWPWHAASMTFNVEVLFEALSVTPNLLTFAGLCAVPETGYCKDYKTFGDKIEHAGVKWVTSKINWQWGWPIERLRDYGLRTILCAAGFAWGGDMLHAGVASISAAWCKWERPSRQCFYKFLQRDYKTSSEMGWNVWRHGSSLHVDKTIFSFQERLCIENGHS